MQLHLETEKMITERVKAEMAHERDILKLRIEAADKGVKIDPPMDDPTFELPGVTPPRVPAADNGGGLVPPARGGLSL
jgi:hypothetical protein